MAEYKEPELMNREELLQKFTTGNNSEICDALLSMTFHEDDWKWAQGQCLYFLEHSNADVRGVAANCLGHIARIHRSLDRELVENALSKHLEDEKISGIIQDTLDDIQIFMK